MVFEKIFYERVPPQGLAACSWGGLAGMMSPQGLAACSWGGL